MSKPPLPQSQFVVQLWTTDSPTPFYVTQDSRIVSSIDEAHAMPEGIAKLVAKGATKDNYFPAPSATANVVRIAS